MQPDLEAAAPRGAHPSPPAVIGWTAVSQSGIAPQNDPAASGPVHLAGHVNAVAASGAGGILVGSDTGGVWQLSPVPGSKVVGAVPVSTDWDNPDVRCVVAGPDGPGHAYAGCRSLSETLPMAYSSMPVLYEAPPAGSGPWQPIMDGASFGTVYAVGVATGHRLVVASTGGVWWAAIPLATATTRSYTWVKAKWPGATVGCTGLAICAGLPVVSAASGGGIWFGQWSPQGDLVMQQGFAGVADAGRTSLAVCATQPQIVWGVIARASDGAILMTAVSTNSGHQWSTISGGVLNDGAFSGPLTLRGGQQGEYNNCIAVSPNAPGTVLIGWQNGVFVSVDSGQNYIRWSGDRPHLHRDVHALYFDPRDPSGHTLFVGSDGGVAQTTDFGATFTSDWNRSLANLQFASVPCHNGYGNASVDPAVAGRIAGGLQDNGVAWGNGGVWREFTGGDGAAAVYLADGRLVAGTTSAVGATLYTDSPPSVGSLGIPPYRRPDGTVVPAGLPDPVVEAVVAPGHAGPPVYAVGGNGPADEPNVVYGLRYGKPDASDAYWHPLATLPAGVAIWSAAAPTDATIYVGTAPAHVYRLDLDITGWPVTEMTGLPTLTSTQATPFPVITRLVPLADGSLLAVLTDSPYTGGASTGQILRYDRAAKAWGPPLNGPGLGLGQEPVFGLDVDPWGAVYTATDDAVYVADPLGAQWRAMSAGLPRRAHLGHLRFIRYGTGGIDLVLSTWGRSVWRAKWQRPPAGPGPGRTGGPGATFDRLIGSLADGRLYELVNGRLVPVGPIDPVLEQRTIATATALTARTAELATALDNAASTPGAGGADGSTGPLRAVTNELQRGLATLETISVVPQKWSPVDLSTYLTAASGMVREVAGALPGAGKPTTPAPVTQAANNLAGALKAHLAAAAALNAAAG
ncbi:MAG: hypothetical protein ACXV3F_09210 [Frankiaceae bacterium]